MKRTTVALFAAVLILVLFATLIPAQAQGLQTYRNAGWGLTLQFPMGWEVDEYTPDLVDISFNNGYDLAGMTLVRDSIYADPNYSLEDVLWDVASQEGVDAEDVQVQPGSPVTVAGVEARTATWVATISGVPVEGDIYIFTKGEDGFGIVTAMLSATWEQHLDQLDSILSSIRIGAAPPTRAPTRQSHRPAPGPTTVQPRPRPTATPTEEPMEPTQEPMIEMTEEPPVAVTEEPPVAVTEEPPVAVTEEPPVAVTEEPPVAVTEEATEQPTEEVTEMPTETATEAVSPTATTGAAQQNESAVPAPRRATPTATISAATPAATMTVVVSPTAIESTVPLTETGILTPTTPLTGTGVLTGTSPLTGTVTITT